tara:strand:+ start:604 stop:894 length:291 start_codon:yes stop_codon:yes gene_type:complete
MLRFNSTNINDLQEEFDLRSTEISIHIVKSVCHALENKIDSITIGQFDTPEQYDLGLYCTEPDYLEALKTNLPKCIIAEEYEICASARDWISRLEK